MTSAQAKQAIAIAERFGCWPDDTEIIEGSATVDVIIGVRKGRRKQWTLDQEGRPLAPHTPHEG